MLIKALERERSAIFDSGKKEGIEERNRQIAQAMLANGFTLLTIAHLLALPLPVVETLLMPPGVAADEPPATDKIG